MAKLLMFATYRFLMLKILLEGPFIPIMTFDVTFKHFHVKTHYFAVLTYISSKVTYSQEGYS